jgi:hypothetical protein
MLIASPIRVSSLLRRLCGPRDPHSRGGPRLVRACGACAHEFNRVGDDRASVLAGLGRSWRTPSCGRDGSNYDGHRQRWREAHRRSAHVMKHCEPAATGQQIYRRDVTGGRRAMPNGPGTVKQPVLRALRALKPDLLAQVRGVTDAPGRAFVGASTPGRILPFWLQRRHFTQIRATTSPREEAIHRA